MWVMNRGDFMRMMHFERFEFLDSINMQPKTAQDRKLIEQLLEMEFVLKVDQDGYIYKDGIEEGKIVNRIVACAEVIS